MPKSWREGLLLVALCAIVFLTQLGATHLWDDDEGFFAETAREMLERGDLVVPWFNGELFAHKPPFMYWMMMGAYRVLGVNEFAARLPSALFGCGTVLLVWRIGRILYSPRAGFWAGIVLATSLNFVVIARAATADAELAFFCTLPIYFFIRRAAGIGGVQASACLATGDRLKPELQRQPALQQLLPAYAAMGVAMLVKGPIGVVLPTSVLGLFLLCQKALSAADIQSPSAVSSLPAAGSFAGVVLGGLRSSGRFLQRLMGPRHVLKTILELRPVTAIILVLLVAGPWYAAVAFETSGAFLEGFFGVHHFGRFTNPMDNHGGPIFYYLVAACVGFFPWIIFLSPTLAQWWTRVRSAHAWRPGDLLCACWVVVWFGLFSLASTKFPHYVVPAYPALALVTAAFLDRWLADGSIYRAVHRRIAWITVAVVGTTLIVALPITARVFLNAGTATWLVGVPLLLGAALTTYLTERGRIVQGLAALTATTAAFLLALFGVAAVEIDRHQNAPAIGAAIRARGDSGATAVAEYGYFRPSLVFYARRTIERTGQTWPATRFLHDHPAGSCLVLKERDYRDFRPQLPADTEVVLRQPWFLKSGESVLLIARRRSDQASPATASSYDGELRVER